MNLIGYARVSTDDQRTGLQVDALKAAGCAEADIFIDYASGARRDRPQLKAALNALRAGDVFMVWKLDRLARSLSHLLQLFEDLAARGVGFRSLTEAIDTTTPVGRFVAQILGALAEFERQLIRERTKAGLDAARRHGANGGRSESGRKLAGHSGPIPKISAEDAAVIRRALAKAGRGSKQGQTLAAEFAQRHGVHVKTIYRQLKRAA